MSLPRIAVLRLIVIAIVLSFSVSAAHAQVGAWGGGWNSGWSNGQSLGGMRYRGPLLSIEIGAPPAPPWHYNRMPPGADSAVRQQERFYHDLDRMHRFQTREERYENDFRDRYSTGDPFYHNPYAQRAFAANVSPEPVFPPSYPHYGRSGPFPTPETQPVPGLAYSRTDAHRRRVHADADVADLLRAAANRLTQSLSRMRDGEVWLNQLQPQRIVSTIDRAEFPGSLIDLVQHYNAVANTPRLVLIAEANGFRDTHRLLDHYVRLQSRYPDAEFHSEMQSIESTPLEFQDLEPREIIISPPSQSISSDSPVELNRPVLEPSKTIPPNVQWLPAPRGERDTDQ
jgi:hypothetical protein